METPSCGILTLIHTSNDGYKPGCCFRNTAESWGAARGKHEGFPWSAVEDSEDPGTVHADAMARAASVLSPNDQSSAW